MKTMQQDHDVREWLSALADGELASAELAGCLQAAENQPESRGDWDAYHVVGAVLRGEPLGAGASPSFVSALSARIAREQTALPVFDELAQPLPELEKHAANEFAFRWKLVTGFASMAAVVAIGWSVAAPWLAAPRDGAMLAGGPQTRAAQQGTQEAQVMIRDPRLDELLAAHKQAGGATALQMPSGFLRNATFDGADR